MRRSEVSALRWAVVADAAGPEAESDGELAIAIAGRREDWPGGPRTLTPREPTLGTERNPLVRVVCGRGRNPTLR